MGLVLLALALGAILAHSDWRWTRPGAGERLAELSPLRAQATVDRYRRTLTRWEPWMVLSLVGPYLALALASGALAVAAPGAAAVVLLGISAYLRPRATAAVRSAAAEQGVEPLRERRRSPTRERRQRPWGAAALLGLAVAQLGLGLDRLVPEAVGSVAVAVGTAGLGVMVVACVVLVQVSGRRYDDERPA